MGIEMHTQLRQSLPEQSCNQIHSDRICQLSTTGSYSGRRIDIAMMIMKIATKIDMEDHSSSSCIDDCGVTDNIHDRDINDNDDADDG